MFVVGTFNGAAVLLEELLDHQVLFLACRHHIFELLLEAVFMVHLSPSGGPDIVLFKNFQLQWPNIDAKKFRNGLKVEAVQKALGGAIDETIQFAEDQIKVIIVRITALNLLNVNIYLKKDL